jgi:GH25 family lysozyme M1 (1,4-beta-N-acetylmuramidase)
MITLGNDIAKYQGDVDYDTYKNNSQFVICKATEGVGYIDTKFKRNQTEARRVGLLLGYYHFCRPDLGNAPEAEANYFLGVVGELKENELIALDYECANQKQTDVTWCKTWLDTVQTKTGVKPFIYLNQSQMKFNWKSVIDAGYGLWLASYTFDPNKNTGNTGDFKSMAMQQWTDKQTVPGITGSVDGNVFFGSLTSTSRKPSRR